MPRIPGRGSSASSWPPSRSGKSSATRSRAAGSSVVGPALGAAGGIRAPFLIHLVLMLAVGSGLLFLGAPRARISYQSDWKTLRSAGFWLASAGILMVALTLGTFDGPLPIHFSELLSQSEIGALYVVTAVIAAGCAALARRFRP